MNERDIAIIGFNKEFFKEFDDWELEQLNNSLGSVLAGSKPKSDEWFYKAKYYHEYTVKHRKRIKQKLQRKREDENGIGNWNVFTG